MKTKPKGETIKVVEVPKVGPLFRIERRLPDGTVYEVEYRRPTRPGSTRRRPRHRPDAPEPSPPAPRVPIPTPAEFTV